MRGDPFRMLGVDPGSASPSGAVFEGKAGALQGTMIAAFDIPVTEYPEGRGIDVLGFVDQVQRWRITHATIERVWAMPSRERGVPRCDRCGAEAFETGGRWRCPCGSVDKPVQRGMGVTSAFKFGGAYHDLKTTVRLCGIAPRFVVPTVWKKQYGLRGSDKEQSRQLALELFPSIAGDLTRKKDEGRAEAALIAKYGARLHATDAEEIEP